MGWGTAAPWGTEDEIRFIQNLGYHRNFSAEFTNRDRVGLLSRYHQGILRRVNWGQMNRATIMEYTEDRIASLSALLPKQEGDKT